MRGISILGVLFYHAKFQIFKYGFLGVDVFFVISGYLIGNIVLTGMSEGEFKFKEFYIKRFRRLIPALLFTILINFIVTYQIFLLDDFTLFKSSVIYTIFFLGNYFFWKTSDYFSPSTDILPLSHLWSLAVEEQFYLIFPIVVFILFRFKHVKKYLKVFLLFIIFVLFYYANSKYYHLPIDCPSANCIEVTNFYWLHTRSWEILIGVYLNFFELKKLKNKNLYLFISSLLIVSSFIFNFSQLSHPGLGTVPVIAGTALVLLLSRKNDINFLGRNSFLLFLGKISYSLYLIHYIFFVSTNYLNLELVIFNIDILPLINLFLSILISYFMWNYIEEPFRNKNRINGRIFISMVIAVTTLILVLTNTNLIQSKKVSFSNEFIFETDFDINRNCFFEIIPDNLTEIDACFQPEFDKNNTLVVGSSIAQNIYKGLNVNSLNDTNIDMVVVTGCPPLLDYYQIDYIDFDETKCEIIYKRILDNLQDQQYTSIIVSYQWNELININSDQNSNLLNQLINKIENNFSNENFIFIGQPVIWKNRVEVFALRDFNFRNSLKQFNRSNLNSDIFEFENIIKKELSNSKIKYVSLIDFLCTSNECKLYEFADSKYYFSSKDNIHITDFTSSKFAIILNEEIKNFK